MLFDAAYNPDFIDLANDVHGYGLSVSTPMISESVKMDAGVYFHTGKITPASVPAFSSILSLMAFFFVVVQLTAARITAVHAGSGIKLYCFGN